LTVSSQLKNPISTEARVLDVFLQAYAITAVATLAGSFGSFFRSGLAAARGMGNRGKARAGAFMDADRPTGRVDRRHACRGLLGNVSWRLGWLAVPLAASVLALLAVRPRPSDAAIEPGRGTWLVLRGNPNVAGWALGELLAFSAWTGTLVFAGR